MARSTRPNDDRAPAEQAGCPDPVAEAGGEHAAEDPAHRLRGDDQPEFLAAAVQYVLDERGEQRAHDALADAGDQREDHQCAQHPVPHRDPQAVPQFLADAGDPLPHRSSRARAGRVRGRARGRAPALARTSASSAADATKLAASASATAPRPAAAAMMPPSAEPASRAEFETWPLSALAATSSSSGPVSAPWPARPGRRTDRSRPRRTSRRTRSRPARRRAQAAAAAARPRAAGRR